MLDIWSQSQSLCCRNTTFGVKNITRYCVSKTTSKCFKVFLWIFECTADEFLHGKKIRTVHEMFGSITTRKRSSSGQRQKTTTWPLVFKKEPDVMKSGRRFVR